MSKCNNHYYSFFSERAWYKPCMNVVMMFSQVFVQSGNTYQYLLVDNVHHVDTEDE